MSGLYRLPPGADERGLHSGAALFFVTIPSGLFKILKKFLPFSQRIRAAAVKAVCLKKALPADRREKDSVFLQVRGSQGPCAAAQRTAGRIMDGYVYVRN
jgi:hypothetical protein